ncbi:hypothetical protein DEO23_01900 [Brachybacterium endophyticum]|uniref:Uncharacterized protein n=1 Tax=Brachybacterium endophyticum TaxID=2182385 RepID=A0A2U2RNG9_9MICO|nr:hypothetical protein DEO23_01900 [Brachybacterium endophyticum]
MTNPNDEWVNGFDRIHLDDDGLISAMLNGVLDTVKDEVLLVDANGQDDLEWIVDEFWTETYFKSTGVENLEVVLRIESDLEGQVDLAFKKWVCRQAPKGAQLRIAELVRYKLHLELSLREFFVGRFSDLESGLGSPSSRKFRDGMRSTTGKLRSDVAFEFETILLEY